MSSYALSFVASLQGAALTVFVAFAGLTALEAGSTEPAPQTTKEPRTEPGGGNEAIQALRDYAKTHSSLNRRHGKTDGAKVQAAKKKQPSPTGTESAPPNEGEWTTEIIAGNRVTDGAKAKKDAKP